MKRNVFFAAMLGMVLAFGLVVLGCNKANAQSSANKKGFTVEGVKVIDDIDSTFKVQAEMESGGLSMTPNSDLGIVGTIEEGKVTLSIPEPTEEMLSEPWAFDYGCETEGMKISQLHISTSKARLTLYQFQSGGYVTIWYANKDGDVEFTDNFGTRSLKSGWNFVEHTSDARVWTSLQDVYKKGYYSWELVDNEY